MAVTFKMKKPKKEAVRKQVPSYDIIAVGSAALDVFVMTDAELIKFKDQKHEEDYIAYRSGDKVLIKQLEFLTGGGGTNTAVAFSRLGLKTGYVGNIGKDEHGKIILADLNNEHVDFLGTTGIWKTGYSIILDSIEHDRTILTYKDANDNLEFSKLDLKRLNTKWFYFSSLMGTSFETMQKLVAYAIRQKIKLAFNPSSYQVKLGMKQLQKMLQHLDVLVFNKEEAAMLVGEGNIKALLKKAKAIGPSVVIITDGKNGAYSYDGKEMLFVQPHGYLAVETTGAGDCFAATVIACLIKRMDMRTALGLAQINAESVISHVGAKNILLTYPVALQRLKKNPVNVSKIA